jgi:transposase-like protein
MASNKKEPTMSIVDRILNGEFDDNNVKMPEYLDPKSIPDKDSEDVEDTEDTEDTEDEGYESDDEFYESPDEFEEIPCEDIDDSDSITKMSDDVPSDEWMQEYVKKNDIKIINEFDLRKAAPAPYIEKPKQSKVREINKNKNTMTTQSNNAPKQSANTTLNTTDALASKRGAPHKLKLVLNEVVRLYNEGVGAKQIAEKYGVSVSCVINTLKRNDISIRPKGRRKSETN